MRDSRAGPTCAVLLVASLALVVCDVTTGWLLPVRARLSDPLLPVFWAAEAPYRVATVTNESLATRMELQRANKALVEQNLELQAAVQRAASVAEENRRLRALLASREKLADQVLVAELLGVSPLPGRQEIMLDKGARDGVYRGQAVLDANGLVGQVVTVADRYSRVLLLTDSEHAIPVQVNRSGVRSVAVGDGEELELLYVPESADVREGDLLISSGLGEVFPAGYPVGTVTAVVHDANAAFARVRARPMAAIGRSREFLLVFRAGTAPDSVALAR